MLLNLSNHPVRGVWNPQKERYENAWSPEQVSAAHAEFGEIIDEPFPIIPPEYSGSGGYTNSRSCIYGADVA